MGYKFRRHGRKTRRNFGEIVSGKVDARNFTKNPRLISRAKKQHSFIARLWELEGPIVSALIPRSPSIHGTSSRKSAGASGLNLPPLCKSSLSFRQCAVNRCCTCCACRRWGNGDASMISLSNTLDRLWQSCMCKCPSAPE